MAKSELHILILSSWYPNKKHPFLGNFVQRHAELLATKYKVTVINTECSDDITELSVEAFTPTSFEEIRVFHPRGKSLMERRKLQEKSLEAGLHKIKSVDLIIGHVILPKGLQFVQAKKHFNCPLIHVEHGSYFRAKIRCDRSWVQKLIIRKTRRHIDEVVAVSAFLRKDMRSEFPRQAISVIGNHIDTDMYNYTPKKKEGVVRFLHVSTMDEKTKNPEGILCAFKALKEQNTDFQLTIICDEDVTQWKHLSTHFGLAEHVQFIGPLEWPELVPYYHEADAFVLFSEYESFSIVLAEAWATGTPTLTTPVGIAHDMSDDLGIQLEKGDRKKLAATLLDFIQHKRNHFDGKKIAEHGMQYSGERILEKWSNLIEKHVG